MIRFPLWKFYVKTRTKVHVRFFWKICSTPPPLPCDFFLFLSKKHFFFIFSKFPKNFRKFFFNESSTKKFRCFFWGTFWLGGSKSIKKKALNFLVLNSLKKIFRKFFTVTFIEKKFRDFFGKLEKMKRNVFLPKKRGISQQLFRENPTWPVVRFLMF